MNGPTEAWESTLTANRLAQLSEYIANALGLHFPRARWRTLERQIESAASEFGFPGTEAFIQWLMSTPLTRESVEALASQLTIAETYFWREPMVFEALREQVLPELIRSRERSDRRLRIWSAGCATGEEPYSIAIALCQSLPAHRDWNITILATDINPRILHLAAAGVYGEWSFRNAPSWLKETYFSPRDGNNVEIRSDIRKMVTFAYLNLVEDIYPSPLNNTNAMDIIFCRNVLMYFTPERARQVGQRCYNSLAPEGWLMVAAAELSQDIFPQFATVRFPGAIVYRKVPDFSREYSAAPFETAPPRSIAPLRSDFEPPSYAATPVGPEAPVSAHERPDVTGELKAAKNYSKEATTAALEQRVRALANEGRLGEALAAYENALAGDKLNPGLYYLGATILQELNREADAVAALNRAIYLDPNFILAHFVLGNMARCRGNTRAAGKYFDNVLALLISHGPDYSLPEGDGLTAGRLGEIVRATISVGSPT